VNTDDITNNEQAAPSAGGNDNDSSSGNLREARATGPGAASVSDADRDTSGVRHGEHAIPTVSQGVYDEIVHWRKTFFQVPSGSIGKRFVRELARLLQRFVDSEGVQRNSLLAFFVFPALLLQKISPDHRAKDHVATLERRLDMWDRGEVEELVDEGVELQRVWKRVFRVKGSKKQGVVDDGRKFSSLMSAGKVHDALRYLSETATGSVSQGVLGLSDTIELKGKQVTVESVLQEKHPPAAGIVESALEPGEPGAVNSVRFEAITAKSIRNAVLETKGSAGPSGLDAHAWRRLCTSFKGGSTDMCSALAGLTRLISTKDLPADCLAPFTSCRLIALNKNPGVRPIGVCEVVRRVTVKAALKVCQADIQKACGFMQTCSGLPCGIEAAAEAMAKVYSDEETEAILLVDASNAFNSVNRAVALHNVKRTCPAIAKLAANSYNSDARLFVVGGGEIRSREGTTQGDQGDPLAMPLYAVSTLPIINKLHVKHPTILQEWYADDSAGAGKLRRIRAWFDDLLAIGPGHGYFVNNSKTQLLVKPHLVEEASRIFEGTGVAIVSDGVRYLGTALGSEDFVADYLERRVDQWCGEIDTLTKFAETEPHAAYCALTHGLRSKWTFIMRTMDVGGASLQPLDDSIMKRLLPAVTGRETFSTSQRDVLRLPTRLGGLAVPDVLAEAEKQRTASKSVVAPLVTKILAQAAPTDTCIDDIKAEVRDTKAQQKREKVDSQKNARSAVEASLPQEATRRLHELSHPGVSSWLTSLPLVEHGFHLGKGDFRDALAIRYDWALANVPDVCVCGDEFTIQHALWCKRGGFPTVRHNEVRDLLAASLTEVCPAVCVEKQLQPVRGETFKSRSTITGDEARLDISARGFWTRGQEAFFDVRVFVPDASSYVARNLETVYKEQEDRKKGAYEERIRNIEKADFCPLVFSANGGTAPSCATFLKRLCSLIADRSGVVYSKVLGFMRCRLGFAILRTAILCVRGARSSFHRPIHQQRELAVVEGRVSLS